MESVSTLVSATTAENFDQDVVEASRNHLVLVDFWAEWCGPCKALAPILESVAEAREGALKVVKINVDDHPRPASTYGVRALPTLMLFRGGQPVGQLVGLQSREAILEAADRAATA